MYDNSYWLSQIYIWNPGVKGLMSSLPVVSCGLEEWKIHWSPFSSVPGSRSWSSLPGSRSRFSRSGSRCRSCRSIYWNNINYHYNALNSILFRSSEFKFNRVMYYYDLECNNSGRYRGSNHIRKILWLIQGKLFSIYSLSTSTMDIHAFNQLNFFNYIYLVWDLLFSWRWAEALKVKYHSKNIISLIDCEI